MEKESDSQISFLEVLVIRENDGTVSTSVYRKKTHTDQYLNFSSHCPAVHKAAVVKTCSQERTPSVLQLMIGFVRREESLQHSRQMVTHQVLY